MTDPETINTSLDSISYKDDSITTLVNFLSNKYGAGSFLINDYFEDNKYAVTFTDNTKNYVFFISTFIKKTGLYYVSCQDLSKKDFSFKDSLTEYKNINLSELESLFCKHLRIK